MRKLSGVILAVVLLVLTSTPCAAQTDTWKNKWYWGAQAGAYVYSTPTQTTEAALQVGGHWLITANRVGLHLSLDQIFFSNTATSQTPGGTTVAFSSGRSMQAELYVIPTDSKLQVYAGGGFAINMVTGAEPQGTFTPQQLDAIQQALDEVNTKAFFVLSAGVQWHLGRWAAFGTYQFMPEGKDFLISTEQHMIKGGLRFALTVASEDVTTER